MALNASRPPLFALLGLALCLGSCSDDPLTGPESSRPRRENSPFASLTVTPDADRGTGTVDLPPFLEAQWVEIVRSGTVTATPEGGSSPPKDADPDGLPWQTTLGYSCPMALSIVYSGGESLPVCNESASAPFTDTIWVQGTGTASLTGGIPDDGGYCADRDCYNYSGSHSVMIRALPRPDLKLEAQPTSVKAGQSVTFTASLTEANISPRRWQVQSYYYEPDPSTGVAPSAPTSLTTTTWSKTVNWTGRMAVIARIDGKPDTAWADVSVSEPPDITIRTSANGVSPILGVNPQTNITYQVRISSDSAYWWPKIKVRIWTSEPLPGGNVTWSGSPGATTHTGPASRTATVRVEADILGRTRTASVNIRVVTCAKNDSILDNKGVRDSLAAAWARSNSADPIAARREQFVWIIRDPSNGNIFAKGSPNVYADPDAHSCRIKPGVKDYPLSWYLGHAHTHPIPPGIVLPLPCQPPGYDPSSLFDEPSRSIDGPGKEDFTAMESPDHPGMMYVLDAKHLHVVTPDGEQKAPPYRRVTGPSCGSNDIAL